MDEQSMEELRMSLSRQHLPRTRAGSIESGGCCTTAYYCGSSVYAHLRVQAQPCRQCCVSAYTIIQSRHWQSGLIADRLVRAPHQETRSSEVRRCGLCLRCLRRTKPTAGQLAPACWASLRPWVGHP